MRSYSFSKLLVLTATGIFLFLVGCDQQSAVKTPTDSETSREPTPTAQEKKLNAALDAMAQDVAAALAKPSVRTLVKKETGKLLAGQRNVLFQTIADKEVQGLSKSGQTTTFAQVLAQQRAGVAKSGKSLQNALTAVRSDAEAIPKFDIGVPVHHDKWNPNETTPLVAFHHRQEIDDTKLKQIKAYDAQGNVHWLDAQEAPDEPVVVVGINERTTASGEVRAAYQDAESKQCIEIKSAAKCGGGGGGGGGGSSEDPREYGDNEYLEEVYLEDEHELFYNGDPEVRVRARDLADTGSDNRGIGYNLFAEGIGANDEKEWESINKKAFTWTEENGGEGVLWFFYEYDEDEASTHAETRTVGRKEYTFDRKYNYDCDNYGDGVVRFEDDDDKYDHGDHEVSFRVESRD